MNGFVNMASIKSAIGVAIGIAVYYLFVKSTVDKFLS